MVLHDAQDRECGVLCLRTNVSDRSFHAHLDDHDQVLHGDSDELQSRTDGHDHHGVFATFHDVHHVQMGDHAGGDGGHLLGLASREDRANDCLHHAPIFTFDVED